MDDVFLNELIEKLAFLTLEADTFEIALLALKLQTKLQAEYGENFL